MPGGDRTGPFGMGARSGRRAGFCSGFHMPGFMNAGMRRGFGGSGRGWRNWFNATGLTGQQRSAQGMQASETPPTGSIPQQQELEVLKNQAASLQESLKEIQGRVAELETASHER